MIFQYYLRLNETKGIINMNRILNEIKKVMEQNWELYLSHVKASELENDGAIFYMNGKDGTEFEWYVNDKLPPFMIFYNDKDNMGALKLMLYKNGDVELYIYEDHGKKLLQEIHTHIEAAEADLLELAVILRNEADDHSLWGANIERFHTDFKPDDEMLRQFLEHKKNYDELKNMHSILNLKALVSRKIADEGWKVGYMERYEPNNPQDSGWAFFAGNEDDTYNKDVRNIVLADVGYVCHYFDPDIFKYIGMPVGSRLIRISPDSFEVDKNEKGIFMAKR